MTVIVHIIGPTLKVGGHDILLFPRTFWGSAF